VPTVIGWFHPLAGPRRAMPLYESRRFGAARPQPRTAECELGHCGVDLGTTLGEPVFAIFDGVVERIERDEVRGANAGRFVRIGHKDGSVVSRYIHLDSIREDLREGARVRGGELIGRLGRTGVEHSGAHLHFALSLRPSGRGGDEHYVDPEPMLAKWQLPSLPAVAQR
jgi:peptidoglycan LD-endopeptidase LytH